MCPKTEGINLRVELETPRGLLYAKKHWCRPRTPEESAQQSLELLWGLCSAIFQATVEGEVFTLHVSAEGLVFLESPGDALAGLPPHHPLVVHADNLTWLPGKPR